MPCCDRYQFCWRSPYSRGPAPRRLSRAGITESDLSCDLGWNVRIVWTDIYDGVQDAIIFDGVVDTVPLGDEFVGISLIGEGTASGSRGGFTVDADDPAEQAAEVDFGPPVGELCPRTSFGEATISPVQSSS